MKISSDTKILFKNNHLATKNKPIGFTIEPNKHLSNFITQQPFHSLPRVSASYFHPSFTASFTEVAKFSNMLDEAIKHPKRVSEQVLNELNRLFVIASTSYRDNFINHGREFSVFKLNSKYVFKSPLGTEPQAGIFKIIKDHKIRKVLKTWYGGIIAKTGNISILKNADPYGVAEPIGAPISMDEVSAVRYYNKICLPMLGALSQKAFDNIAMDFKRLNDFVSLKGVNYAFETTNPNNFLMVNDKIKIVDELDILTSRANNDLGELLNVFLLNIQALNHPKVDYALIGQKRNILIKCIIANEKAGLPVVGSNQKLSKSLQLAGIKESADKVLMKILDLRSKTYSFNKREKLIKKYLNNLE